VTGVRGTVKPLTCENAISVIGSVGP
jgi:hypothetical protein